MTRRNARLGKMTASEDWVGELQDQIAKMPSDEVHKLILRSNLILDELYACGFVYQSLNVNSITYICN